MQSIKLILCVVLAVFFGAKPVRAEVIYQAFNEPFASIHDKLDYLAAQGYKYIQLSPPQKSIDNDIWWARYQPVDFSVIEGPLGNEAQLFSLIQHAHQVGLKVLIDIVFNHMADPFFYGHNLQYPQFSAADFHYPDTGPCITNWSDRWQVTNFWLCGDPAHPERKLPDLNTSSPYVRSIHKQFLEKLIDLGADGFRFDAVKHMEPEYFAYLVSSLPDSVFYYGEVVGENLWESQLYTPSMKITDFHLLRLLLQVFSWNGDMHHLIYPEGAGAALPGDQSVVFSRNHDTVNNANFFAFSDIVDAQLANAYVIARGVGMPLIYREDAYDPTVSAAVRFHRYFQGASTYVRKAEEVCLSQSCEPQNVLFIERGNRGVAIINKADRWLDTNEAVLQGINPGCYKELRYNFSIQVSSTHKVLNWGKVGQSGIHVGPRSALFFVPTSCKSNVP